MHTIEVVLAMLVAVAISGYLFLAALPSGGFAQVLHTIFLALMVAAMLLTAWSGIDYLVKSWPAVSKMG